jgi:hypothetical protein
VNSHDEGLVSVEIGGLCGAVSFPVNPPSLLRSYGAQARLRRYGNFHLRATRYRGQVALRGHVGGQAMRR